MVIVVIAFITLGKYLEAKSKIKTGDAIEKLLGLQAKTALVLVDGVEKEKQELEQLLQRQQECIIILQSSELQVKGRKF